MSLTQQILTDLKIDLADKFDRNFQRKGFFGKRWTETKHPNSRGSLMQRSGKLRRSIIAKVQGNAVVFSSNLPYAGIHNEGGTIKVFGHKTVKLPKRQFIGDSLKLRAKIRHEITKDLKRILS